MDDGIYRWTFAANASGVYRLQSAASDWWGATSTHSYEFKVELDDPTASATVTSGGEPVNGWYGDPVTVRIDGEDAAGGSGVAMIDYQLDDAAPVSAPNGTEVTASSDGVQSLRYRARDGAGRTSAWQVLELAVGTTAPDIARDSADGRWHAAAVSLGCMAADATSGLASVGDARFSLTTSVANGDETADAATGTRDVCDRAGNSTTAAPIASNRLDRKAPS